MSNNREALDIIRELRSYASDILDVLEFAEQLAEDGTLTDSDVGSLENLHLQISDTAISFAEFKHER